MARFFNPKADLDAELCAYFGGFQQVVSYLYDPDGFFSGNLRRCGVKHLVEGSPKVDPAWRPRQPPTRPAARTPRALPTTTKRACALRPAHCRIGRSPSTVPGVGGRTGRTASTRGHPSRQRRRAQELAAGPLGATWAAGLLALPRAGLRPRLLLVGGEADVPGPWPPCARRGPRSRWPGWPAGGGWVCPCRSVAALLAGCRVVRRARQRHLPSGRRGRRTPCVLLFGPTDPDIWAPPYPSVRVVRAGGRNHGRGRTSGTVRAAVAAALVCRVHVRSIALRPSIPLTVPQPTRVTDDDLPAKLPPRRFGLSGPDAAARTATARC